MGDRIDSYEKAAAELVECVWAKDKVIIVRGQDKQWRWRRVAANGEIVGASTEGYVNFNDCRNNYFRSTIRPFNDFSVEIED